MTVLGLTPPSILEGVARSAEGVNKMVLSHLVTLYLVLSHLVT